MKTTLIAVSVTVLSVGCQQAPLTDFRENAQEVIEDARGRADEWRELSAEELQELWAIEYTSLEVAHADFARADELLNEMGRERWECYHVSGNGQRRVFYFKRNKSNLTAYLTRSHLINNRHRTQHLPCRSVADSSRLNVGHSARLNRLIRRVSFSNSGVSDTVPAVGESPRSPAGIRGAKTRGF